MSLSAPTPGPRERLHERGLESLSDAELVALLLGTGTQADPVMPLAERLLGAVGGLRGLSSSGTGELLRVRGVGATKAARLVAGIELGRRVHARPLVRGARMGSSEDIFRAFGPQLAHLPHEELWAVALDARHRVLARVLLARGGLSACPVTPGDVFRPLIREAASALVLVHNHPSGVAEPSREDVALSAHIASAGKLLGIALLDHVVVAAEGYVSLLDSGLLEPP
jgi:DNA repair protein RadC